MNFLVSLCVLSKLRCKVSRKTKEGDLVVCPDIACDNLKDAEHLASTLALYHLCKGQVIGFECFESI